MRKISFILVLLLFISPLVKAQEVASTKTVFLVPFNLLNNGLRIDLEHQIGDSNQDWLLIGPQFYYKDISEFETFQFSTYEGGKLRGAGLELAYKHFLKDKEFGVKTYYALGLSYQYFDIETNENLITSSIEFEKLGAHFIIGFQIKTRQRLAIDLFTGLGFRYTLESSEDNWVNEFGDYSWNYGYSGPAILLGVKIGILL